MVLSEVSPGCNCLRESLERDDISQLPINPFCKFYFYDVILIHTSSKSRLQLYFLPALCWIPQKSGWKSILGDTEREIKN
jgi:hypothetical protein